MKAGALSASAMMAPALILVGVFILIPAIVAVVGSFFDFSMTSSSWTYVGGANYRRAVTDPLFWLAISNNIFIVVGSVISQVGGGAILAAIVLTIAALIALSAAIGRHEIGGYEIQNPVSPVSGWRRTPAGSGRSPR